MHTFKLKLISFLLVALLLLSMIPVGGWLKLLLLSITSSS